MTTPPPDPADLIARLTSTRAELRRARMSALDRLDEAHRRALSSQSDLEALRDAPERRWWLRQRQRLLVPLHVARHPLQTARALSHRVALALGLHRLGPPLEHALYTTTPLRGVPPASQTTDQPSPADAIRWLGPATVHGVSRQALFVHPTSTVTWQVPLPRRARVVVSCGLVPDVARQNPDGVVFTLTVTRPDGSVQRAERLLRPRVAPGDRFWRTLEITTGPVPDADVTITIGTSLPPNGAPDYAWALLGEPRLLARRPLRSITALALAVWRRDGWRGALARLRAGNTTQDGLADYQRWIATHTADAAALARRQAAVAALPLQPTFSVITPVYNTDPRWLRACVDSVRAQIYPHWQLYLVDDASTRPDTRALLDALAEQDRRITVIRRRENGHISRASNDGLAAATGEFIALLDHDDTLAPEALAAMAEAINTSPDVDFLYSDEDKLDEAGGRCDPYFKPDWSPEHFLNFMYTNHLMVLRRSLVARLGGFRAGFEGSQDFDLALRVVTETTRVGHVPEVLYHWRKIPESTAGGGQAKPWAIDAARRALLDHVARTEPDSQVLDVAAPGLFRVKRPIKGQPPVTLVITTDDRSREIRGRVERLLPNLVRSIVQKTAYANYELLVVDNGRLSDESRDVLAGTRHRRVSYTIEGRFNFAHKLNFSMRHATGDHVVILNDDIEVISSEWLTALLEYSQDPAVGAVGARLLYPDGRLQHIGVVLGVCGVAAHCFHQAPGHHPGYFGSAYGPRNYSAVTGACLMTRRAVFEALGGFNERLAIDFNDIDFCLRVRRAGYRIVYTPYAELYHLESGTISDRTWDPAETQYMRDTWADVIARDPYYNPNLTREYPDYRL